METYYKHNINLSDRQKKNLQIAVKKQRNVTVGLTNDQLSNGDVTVKLTNTQNKSLQKALKNNKGLRLTLNYDQVGSGLLNDLLVKAEDNLPLVKKISPLIRKNLAPLLKDKLLPWLENLIDKELDDVIKNDAKGSGLKKQINRKIDSIISEATKKKLK